MQDLEIITTQDGSNSVLSRRFGVSYHSRYGAIQESRHVFVEAGLFAVAPGLERVDLLEIGFGTGLNTLLSLQEAGSRGWQVRYEAVEGYPMDPVQALKLNYPQVLNAPDLAEAYEQMHGQPWNELLELKPFFQLYKRKALVEELSFPEPAFDLIYFDAFAPNAQPELWELPVLRLMEQALRPGGMLVTYCAKGSFKRNLRALGLEVEALPGPPGKREMTRALKPVRS